MTDAEAGASEQKRARIDGGDDARPDTAGGAETANNSNGIPDSQRLYQCRMCQKSYARLDHLSRHVRQHTQEKPYACDVCTKAFARADLLKRHRLGHSKDEPNAKPTIVQHSRVSQACEACSNLHLKCEEEKPCKRCTKKNITCNFVPSFPSSNDVMRSPPQNLFGQEQQPYPAHGSQMPNQMSKPMSMSPQQMPTQGMTPLPQVQSMQQTTPMSHRHSYSQQAQMSSMPSISGPPSSSQSNMQAQMPIDPAMLPPQNTAPNMFEYLRDKMMQPSAQNGVQVMDFSNGPWTRELFDFGVDTNMELNDMVSTSRRPTGESQTQLPLSIACSRDSTDLLSFCRTSAFLMAITIVTRSIWQRLALASPIQARTLCPLTYRPRYLPWTPMHCPRLVCGGSSQSQKIREALSRAIYRCLLPPAWILIEE